MATIKVGGGGGGGGATTAPASSQRSLECCMCGDYGLSSELFRCKICQFRSQHRYCSNLYPKADSYRVCNWCLSQNQKDDSVDQKAQNNSSNSSSSIKSNNEDDVKSKIKRNNISEISDNNHHGGRGQAQQAQQQQQQQKGNLRLQINKNNSNNGPIMAIKKQIRSPERSPSSAKKRINTSESMEENLRRTRSEELSNSGVMIRKQVFRNKVRRYKLLDEVSS